MNIGFLQPYSILAVDVTTLLKQFAKDGHKVVFITLTPKGDVHKVLENDNIIFETLDLDPSTRVKKLLLKAKDIINICKKHDLDILYNNFSMTQMIGLLSSPFIKTKMIYLRHHSTDAAKEFGVWKDPIIDKAMNKLSAKTIVPSERVRNDIIAEGGRPEDVIVVPYCYDFNSYPQIDQQEVAQIRERFAGKKLFLMISRYVPEKRYELAVQLAARLRSAGYNDFAFLCLGDGFLEDDIRKLVTENNLEEHFFLEGFKENVITYIAACDLLVHTSASEASCHAIKEAGWMRKNVICCENVGDFSDYLVDEQNAFLVEKDFPVEPMFEKIRRFLDGEIVEKDRIAEVTPNPQQYIIHWRLSLEVPAVLEYERKIARGRQQ